MHGFDHQRETDFLPYPSSHLQLTRSGFKKIAINVLVQIILTAASRYSINYVYKQLA